MTEKKFNLWNRIAAAFAFVVSAFTYLSTIEPTASFWDCGEFIASSYKLEVGHPPGNPTFQLFARIFTMFGDNMHAAVLVNAMSALCSALTILFLYLTIVWFARRMATGTGSTAFCFYCTTADEDIAADSCTIITSTSTADTCTIIIACCIY